MITNLKSLIDRLNATCRSAMEGAAGLCLSNTHYEVDIEHVLLKILEQSNTDLHCILQHFEINPSNVQQDLTDAIEGLKRGNTRTPVLSPHLPKLYEQAWLEASINFKTTSIRSGHLILALLSNKELIRVLQD